ncbi:MAG: hypothetical protein ACLFMX_03845 [Halobacteriales archaeon]
MTNPAGVSFFHDRGTAIGDVTDPARVWRTFATIHATRSEPIGRRPPLVRVTFDGGPSTRGVELDEYLAVLDVRADP